MFEFPGVLSGHLVCAPCFVRGARRGLVVAGLLAFAMVAPAAAAPSVTGLKSSSDLGSSNTDGITSDNTPTFVGTRTATSSGTVTVRLCEGTTQLGTDSVSESTTAWEITSITLADGVHNVAATEAAACPSTESTVAVTIDTDVPEVSTVTAINGTTSELLSDGELIGFAPNQFSVSLDEDRGGIGTASNFSLRSGTCGSVTGSSQVTSVAAGASDDTVVVDNTLLTTGDWCLEISGLEDVAGNTMTSFDIDLTVDVTPPTVTQVTTGADTRIDDFDAMPFSPTTEQFSSIKVRFSEEVDNPANHTDSDDVTNPANYLLVEAGPDEVIDTATCSAGLQDDDVAITVTSVTYATSPHSEATLSLNGGSNLSDGSYTLFVCGTTSIVDLAGNALDGDGNTVGGDDYSVAFVISPVVDLTITVPTAPTEAVPGAALTYTLRVANAGPASVDFLEIQDLFGSWLFAPVVLPSEGFWSGDGGLGELSGITLDASTSVDLVVSGFLDPEHTASLTVDPMVSLRSGSVNNGDSQATSATSITLQPTADGEVTKDNGASSFTVSDTVDWNISIRNLGPSSIPGASFVDDYTLDADFVCPRAGQPACWFCTEPEALTPITTLTDGASGVNGLNGAYEVAVTTDGQYAFVAGFDDDRVAAFSIAGDGALTFVEQVSVATNPRGLAVSPDGGYVYVLSDDGSDGTLSVLSWDGSSLASVETESDASFKLDGGEALAISPDGAHVYAVSSVDDAVSTFSRDPSTGELTFVEVIQDDSKDSSSAAKEINGASDVAVTSDGRYVVVVADINDAVTVFSRETDEAESDFGSLTFETEYEDSDLPAGPTLVEVHRLTLSAVNASGVTTIYASAKDNLVVLELDTSGSPTISHVADHAVGDAEGVAVAPSGDRVVIGSDDATAGLVAFARASDGTLSAREDFALGSTALLGGTFEGFDGVRALVFTPDSRNLLVVGFDDDALSSLRNTAGASCPSASGSAAINESIDLPPDSYLLYELRGAVSANPSDGHLTNTATLTSPATVVDSGDVASAAVSATDTDSLGLAVDLSIDKSDLGQTAIAGSPFTYEISVANGGPANITGLTVEDDLPIGTGAPSSTPGFLAAGLEYFCEVELGSASCGVVCTEESPCSIPASGAFALTSVQLNAGSEIKISITGTIDPFSDTTDTLDNTATATFPVASGSAGYSDSTPQAGCPAGTDACSTETTTVAGEADLSILKTHAPADVLPGDPVTYTLVVTNQGPSATAATVVDNFDVLLDVTSAGNGWACTVTTAPASATDCDGAGGATDSGTGNINQMIQIEPGGVVTFTIDADVNVAAEGVLTNAASVQPVGATDGAQFNNTSKDRITLTAISDLAITKAASLAVGIPGEMLDYTITVTNNGPEPAFDVTVTDLFPAELLGVEWTCSADSPIRGFMTFIASYLDASLIDVNALVSSPDGSQVFAVASGGSTLAVLERNQVLGPNFGELTPPAQVFTHGSGGIVGMDGPVDVAISPDGNHIYVAAATSESVALFVRDSNGNLSFGGALVGEDGLGGIAALAISPDGLHLYTAGTTDGQIGVFQRDPSSGLLTAKTASTFANVDGIFADQLFVYASSSADDKILAFERDDASASGTFGLLTKRSQEYVDGATDGSANTIDGLQGVSALALSADGNHLYAVASTDNAIATFSRDLGTGDLTFIESLTDDDAAIDGLDGAVAIAVASDGQHVLAGGDDGLSVFRRNVNSGRLTFEVYGAADNPVRNNVSVSGVAGLRDILVTPNVNADDRAAHVYTADFTGNRIGAFRREGQPPRFAFVEAEIDQQNGVDGMDGARAISVSADGEHVYVLAQESEAVSLFERDLLTSELTYVESVFQIDAGVDGLAEPKDMVLSGDGKHLYVAASDVATASVALFIRETDSGLSSFGSLSYDSKLEDNVGGVVGLAGATGLALDPTGKHLYVASQFDHSVVVFSRNDVDGQLTFVQDLTNGDGATTGAGPVAGMTGAFDVAVSSDGLHVYVASSEDDSVVVFGREASAASPDFGKLVFKQRVWGAIDVPGGMDRPLGLDLSGSDGEPVGGDRHLYVTSFNTDSLIVLRRNVDPLDEDFGELTYVERFDDEIDGVRGLEGARTVEVSADGAQVYVTAESGDAFTVFSRTVDPDSPSYGQLVFRESQIDDTDGVDGLRQPYGIASTIDNRSVYVASLGDRAVSVFQRLLGSSCTASGAGDIADTVNLAFGGTLTYSASGLVAASATGTLSNTATVEVPVTTTDNDSSNDSSTAVTPLSPRSDLRIRKSDGTDAVVAGERTTYVVEVYNEGPSNAVGALVVDEMSTVLDEALPPQAIYEDVQWTCQAAPSGLLIYASSVFDDVGGVDGLAGVTAIAASDEIDPDEMISGDEIVARHVYVTGLSDDAIAVFSRNSLSGDLTPVEVITNGGGTSGLAGASSVVVSPFGRHVYATGQVDDSVVAFTRAGDGTLTFIEKETDGAGLDGLDQPRSVVLSPDGSSLYVAASNDDAITVFSRDDSSGELTFVESVMDGDAVGSGVFVDGIDGANDAAVSPDGNHVYVVGSNDGAVAVFDRDTGDGSLDFVEVQTSVAVPELAAAAAVAVSPDGNQVYVVAPHALLVFVRAGDGTLTLSQTVEDEGGSFAGTVWGTDVLVSQDGFQVYVAGRQSNSVTTFRRDPANDGFLTPLQTVRDGNNSVTGLAGASALAISPDGAFVLAAGQTANAVVVFERPADSACDAAGSGDLNETVDVGAGASVTFAVDVRIDSGTAGQACSESTERVCVTNAATVTLAGDADLSNNADTDENFINRIADLRITKTDGQAQVNGLVAVTDVAVSPDGEHAYTTAPDGNAVGMFSVQSGIQFVEWAQDGVDGVDGLSTASALAISPTVDSEDDGQHLYVVGTGDNAIAVFRRETDGTLAFLEVETDGAGAVAGMTAPSDVFVSPDGEHVYVVAQDAIVLFARETNPESVSFGQIEFLESLVEGVSGVTQMSGVAYGAITPDVGPTDSGAHVILSSPSEDAVVVLTRNTNEASAAFGSLTVLERLEDSVDGVTGLGGVSRAAVDPSAGRVYFAAADLSAVTVFEREQQSTESDFGQLTLLGSELDASGPFGIDGAFDVAVSIDGAHLYVAGEDADSVAVFETGAATTTELAFVQQIAGGATAVPAGLAVLTGPRALALLPTDDRLLVAAAESDALVSLDREINSASSSYGELSFGVSALQGDGTVAPGSLLTYFIEVFNEGPSDVVDARVVDVFPPQFSAISWSCPTTSGGATCPAGTRQGDIDQLVDIPAGGSILFEAAATVLADIDGSITNVASITEPPGVIDLEPGNNSAEDDDTVLGFEADLEITKDDGQTEAVPGEYLTYEITVTNHGPSAALGTQVVDWLPEALSDIDWTCTPTRAPGSLQEPWLLQDDGTTAPIGSATPTSGLLGASGLTVSVDGRSLYVAATDDNTITVFDRDVRNGELTAVQEVTEADVQGEPGEEVVVEGLTGVVDLVVSADDAFLYAVSAADDAVAAFSRDSATGELTYLQIQRDGTGAISGLGGASAAVLSPDGLNLYAAGPQDSTVVVFSRSLIDGTLALLEQKSQGAGGVLGLGAVSRLAIDASGSFLYALGTSSNAIAVFSRGPSGNLTFVDWVQEGDVQGPVGEEVTVQGIVAGRGLVLDGDRLLVVGEDGSGNDGLALFEVQGDGVPLFRDFVSETEVSTLAGASAAAIRGDRVYGLGADAATLVLLRIDSASGSMVLVEEYQDGDSLPDADSIADDTLAGLDAGTALLLPTGGRHLYVTSADSDSLLLLSRPAGVVCRSEGTGNLFETVDLPPDTSAVFQVQAQVNPSALGTLVNTATAIAAEGVIDDDQSNNEASDSNDLTPEVDLLISKDDGVTEVVAGTQTVYTIAVSNPGPSDVADVLVTDLFGPAFLPGSIGWTCMRQAGLVLLSTEILGGGNGLDAPYSVATSVSGDVAFVANHAADALSVFTIDGAGVATFAGSAVDEVALGSETVEDLDGAAAVVATYDGRFAYVASLLDDSLTVFEWDGSDLTLVQVLADGVDAFGLDGAVALTMSADQSSLYVAARDSDSVAVFERDPITGELTYLERLKDGLGGVPGGALTGPRALTVAPNGGHVYVAATDANTISVFERAADGTLTYLSRVINGTNQSGTVIQGIGLVRTLVVSPSGAHLYAGGLATDAVALFERDGATGALTYIERIQDGDSGVDGLDGPFGLASNPTGELLFVAARNDNAISVFSREWSSGSLSFAELVDHGTVSELDGVRALAVTSDRLFAVAEDADALLVFELGAPSYCDDETGSGAMSTEVDLTAGSQVIFQASAAVASDATGNLLNQADAVVPAGVFERELSNNVAMDDNTILVEVDLRISKDNGRESGVAGEPTTYTIEVDNTGPSDAVGATVTDLVPPELVDAEWTCVANGGASCTPGPTAGSIADLVDLPTGSSLIYTLTTTVDGAHRGALLNQASVTVAGGTTETMLADNFASDEDAIVGIADAQITKDDGVTSVAPGGTVTYTIEVTNLGPSAAELNITDLMPVELLTVDWECVGVDATCPGGSGPGDVVAGSGDIIDAGLVEADGKLVYTVTAQVDPGLDPTSGLTITNTATVATTPLGADPTTINNSASDTDGLHDDTLFSDGFENGSTSLWSTVVGSVARSPFVDGADSARLAHFTLDLRGLREAVAAGLEEIELLRVLDGAGAELRVVLRGTVDRWEVALLDANRNPLGGRALPVRLDAHSLEIEWRGDRTGAEYVVDLLVHEGSRTGGFAVRLPAWAEHPSGSPTLMIGAGLRPTSSAAGFRLSRPAGDSR